MRPLRVLIVAGCFAPSAVIGAKRPTGVALELKRQGHWPFVLTLLHNCYTKIDASRETDELNQIPVVRTRCYSIWNHSRKWKTASNPISKAALMAGHAFSKFTRPLAGVDKLEPWARNAIATGTRAALDNKVDVIWTTVPDLSSAMLANNIHQATKIPFVIDYRDLISTNTNTKSKLGVRKLAVESSILGNCAGVTCVAPRQLESLRDDGRIKHDVPVELVYNFFDNSSSSLQRHTHDKTVRSQTVDLVYGGALYGGERRIAGVISALAKLNTGDRVKQLKFRFFGNSSDQVYVSKLAQESKVVQLVELNNPVPQTEFDLACRNAAIQVLIVGHGKTHEDTIPAKLYDYFLANRPILVVGPANCFAGQMVEGANRGIAVDDSDVEALANAIEQLSSEKNRDGRSLEFDEYNIEQYSRPHCVGKLAKFLAKVIER